MPRADDCCTEDLDTTDYGGNFVDASDVKDVDIKEEEEREEEELVL